MPIVKRLQGSLIASVMVSALITTAAFGQRDLKDIPPTDPKLEQASFIVPEGFEVNLFASDPQIASPIQMNFDAQGRLWIASSEVYPHIKPGQKATDKILVLEDNNRDGKAEKVTAFAEGLLIPTGVAPDLDDGAYVVNSTELLHLRDTDGDGKADERRVVLSGFGTEDTHHLLHTLRWGHDGALYMNQSIYIHSHVETPYGVRRLNGGGVWRFKPELLKLDIVCRGFVNPWGHHFDYWGQEFATDGAYGEGINFVFPGAVYVTAPGAKRRLQGLNPGSPKHCGLEILSGRHLPESWRGTMVTNDFRAHRVCRFVVSEDGSGFASRQEVEIIKSKHVAFRPIDVKMGPDGAIYVADWYNPIIQHGEVDFRDPRRDHVHGRIWRVTAKDRPLLPKAKIRGADVPELLKLLGAEEEWLRLHAKLRLKSMGVDQVTPHLQQWLSSLSADDDATKHLQLEALWLYESLNVVNEELLQTLLASPDHRVRAAAIRVVTYWSDRLADPAEYFRRGVKDEHPRVRLHAVRGLAELPSLESARTAAKVLDRPMDRFLDFALWQAMRDLQAEWLPAVRKGDFDFDGDVNQLAFALKSVDSPDVVKPLLQLIVKDRVTPERMGGVLGLVASLGNANDLTAGLDIFLARQSSLTDSQRADILQRLVSGSKSRRLTPKVDSEEFAKLFASEDGGVQAAVAKAAGAWKLKEHGETLRSWAGGNGRTAETRLAAIDALSDLGGRTNVDMLVAIARSNSEFATRERAANRLVALDRKLAISEAIRLLTQLPKGANADSLLAPLLASKGAPAELAVALAKVKLAPDTAKLALRAVQRSAQAHPPLLEAVRKSGGLSEAGWKLTPDLLKQLVGEVARDGDPSIGQQIYRRAELQCSNCHSIGGAGGRVGPDMVSLGASAQVDYLIESLIEPNKKVKENYHSLTIITDDGNVIPGIPIRKNKTEVVLRNAEDREIVIPVTAIDEQKEGRSLMPDGTVDSLTRIELVHVVRFLSELGKVGEFAVGKEQLVRTWQLLLPTREALHRIRRTSFDTAASDDPVFTWRPVYSLVSGDLPTQGLEVFNAATYVTRKDSVKTAFLRCHVQVSTPGVVKFLLNDAKAVDNMWVDGKPKPPQKEMLVNLGRGRHSLCFAVDSLARKKPLRVELVDAPGSAAKAQIINGK